MNTQKPVDGIPAVRIFVSSPGDVPEERNVALTVIRRLSNHFQGRLRLIPVLWEQEPLLATAGFQEEIDRRIPPSGTDVAVFILWSRLGTPLSSRFRLEDGRRPGGAEWEFLEARRGAEERGAPHMLVYRKSAKALISLDGPHEERREREAQFEALGRFFDAQFRDGEHLAFKGSYHRFADPSAFGCLLDEHLSKLLAERIAGAARGAATWHAPPFRGLQAFGTEHAPIFFGRGQAIHAVRQALAEQVRAQRAFVLILGPSGNGKSSLARAGLLPLLSGPWVVEPELGGGFCRAAVLRPAEAPTPLQALARALQAPGALPDLSSHGDERTLAAALGDGPQAAVALIRGALAREADHAARRQGAVTLPAGRLVVLVDQFEEVYTREGVSPQDREAFERTLDALARSGCVWVLATLRSDFYPAFAASNILRGLKEGAGQYDLPAPDAAEVAQIVRGPALVAGLRYEVRANGQSLENALVESGVRGADALPLLEFLLSELWEQKQGDLLTFAAYERLGGLEGALSSHAEATWRGLPAEAQAALPGVVRALVEVGEGAESTATRRRAPYRDVASTPEAKILVDSLVAARLLVAEGVAGETYVSVAHEALLRAWPRVAQRLTAEAELLRVRSRLRSQAARYASQGRDRSLLLASGLPLAEARLLRSAGFVLSPPEQGLVDASERRARRVAWLRRAVVTAIALLAMASSLLAYLANDARQTAEGLRDDTIDMAHLNESVSALRAVVASRETLFPVDLGSVLRAGSQVQEARRALNRGSELRALVERAVRRGTTEKAGIGLAYLDWVLLGNKSSAPQAIEVLEQRFAGPAEDVEAWDRAIAEIADAAASPAYAGLRIERQFSLTPLGRDPKSGLHEFAHVYSGSVPTRGPDGTLVQREDAGIVFVLLPAGAFWRGAARDDAHNPDAGAHEDEGPVHRVRITEPFFLSKYECTQAQWRRLTGGSLPSEAEVGKVEGVTVRHPVEHISWEDCMGTPGWLQRYWLRLPTEAEWEYGARAPRRPDGTTIEHGTPFTWGDDHVRALELAAVATREDAGRRWGHSVPVGKFHPNGFGLHDVHGNVSEWCLDWYDRDAYARGEELADPAGPKVSPRGQPSHHVYRGGSWRNPVEDARVSWRSRGAPTLNFGFIGCRPARSLQPIPPSGPDGPPLPRPVIPGK